MAGSEPARTDTKKAIVLELLQRKQGAAMSEIGKATGWQNHTIRGFISGNVTKKMGLAVESFKSEASAASTELSSKPSRHHEPPEDNRQDVAEVLEVRTGPPRFGLKLPN